MAYRFQTHESVDDSLIRIAREQIGKALDEIDDGDLDRHETVHQVRKRCKKLRALLRIFRPALGSTYKIENRCFRDAARTLSYVRDCQSLVDTVGALCAHFSDELDAGFGHDIRTRLVERRRRVAGRETDLDRQLSQFRETMRQADDRAGRWTLRADGFAAVSGGLAKTYARGRRARNKASAAPSAARFHEWRKRTKYHGFHLRLLRPVWPAQMAAVAEAAGDLSDLLGNEHDLAVLQEALEHAPRDFGDVTELEVMLALIDRRRLALQQQAGPLGRRVFAETPDALVARVEAYWRAWSSERHLVPGVTPA